MGYSKDAEKYHRSLIKRIILIKPELRHNAWGIKKELERLSESPLRLHQDYIAKLLKKLNREIDENFKRQKALEFVRDYQNIINEMGRVILSIVFSPDSSPLERIAASREVRAAYTDVFDKLIASGIFEQVEQESPETAVSLQERLSAPQKMLGVLRVMREMGHITDKEILESVGVKVVGELGKGINGNGTKHTETDDAD